MKPLAEIGAYFENGIIDLIKLNTEREELASAQKTSKIAIFIDKEIVLENKWHQNIDLSFVELKSGHLWKPYNPFPFFEYFW